MPYPVRTASPLQTLHEGVDPRPGNHLILIGMARAASDAADDLAVAENGESAGDDHESSLVADMDAV